MQDKYPLEIGTSFLQWKDTEISRTFQNLDVFPGYKFTLFIGQSCSLAKWGYCFCLPLKGLFSDVIRCTGAVGDVQRCLTKKPMQRNSAHGCARLCKVYGGGVTITAVKNLKLRTLHHV